MKTNDNQRGRSKNKGSLKIFALLLILIAITLVAGFAFARYVTMLNGNAQVPIAKWSFDYKILNGTQTREVSDFSITRTDNNADVDPSTIAPGTSGQFIVEIDATGTETLLIYETKMTLTNKPKNLKFYWDSSKTQEIVVENETYLALNGFMSLEDNKKRDISIYWEWPLETGSSQNEIDENDIIDSEFMGKTMSMQIATTGRQVMSNPYASGVASTTINGSITVYNSVQDAIDAAGTNQGAIVTLLKDNIVEAVTINSNQDLVFNTNGKKITSDGTTLTNLGKTIINGNGTVESTTKTSGVYAIINSGNLEILKSTISSGTTGIVNRSTGTLIVNGAAINTSNSAIYNSGVANSEANPAIKIFSGDFFGGSNGIYSSSTGTIVIYGGNIRGGGNGIQNDGNETIIIKGGKIIANKNHGIRNSKGTIKIYNGEITAVGDGIWTTNSGGSVLITGGIIKGGTNGVVSPGGNGVNVTIGTNDNVVNSNTPVIMTTQSGAGIRGGSITFYDGIVKVPINLNLINNYSNATVPAGYHLARGDNETIDGVEYKVMYLVKD